MSRIKRRPIHLCDHCRTRLFHSTPLDAWWCPRCDCWAESTCGDPDCLPCAERPERPSMMRRKSTA